MKKRILALTVAALLLLLAACGKGQSETGLPVGEGEAVTRLKIVHIDGNGNSALVVDSDPEEHPQGLATISWSGAELFDADMEPITADELRPGMVVEMVWDGTIMESYPGIYSAASVIRVVEQQDDLVGFYRQVLNDLWENDAALNHDVTTLGFDFSGLTNLTEGEQSALKYLVSCDFGLGLQYVFGSWEELCDEGYIDKENLYWEDGVFLSIIITEEGNDKFTFEAQKWRSGTGAIWFKGCTAARGDNGQWSYEMGSFAIS